MTEFDYNDMNRIHVWSNEKFQRWLKLRAEEIKEKRRAHVGKVIKK